MTHPNSIKHILTCILILFAFSAFSQKKLPTFLAGTWKVENKDVYERWDILNATSMKGFSYIENSGKMSITEYLEIAPSPKGEFQYVATVLEQNNGKEIAFKMKEEDSIFIFENPQHDFPKKIIYKKIKENTLEVTLSSEKKSNTYMLHKEGSQSDISLLNSPNPNYDEALAKKLNADDYGMKMMVFVMLKTGSNTTNDKEFVAKCFNGHMENINKMVSEGKLLVAGPMGKNEFAWRGIFILNVASVEEAKELLKNDPAVANNILVANISPWYGSAALGEYLPSSDKIWKTKP